MIEIISSVMSGFVSGIVGRFPMKRYTTHIKKCNCVNLNNLTDIEKRYIALFYDEQLNAFISKAVSIPETNENYNVLVRLRDRNVLKYHNYGIPSFESYDANGVNYRLSSDAMIKLNRRRYLKIFSQIGK